MGEINMFSPKATRRLFSNPIRISMERNLYAPKCANVPKILTN